MTISAAVMPELDLALSPHTHWFAPRCCVVVRGDERTVLVGGRVIATIGPGDVALRNLLLVGLAEEPDVHLGVLSRAFGLSSEAVRQLRRLYETDGLEPLLRRKRGNVGPTKRPLVEARVRKLLEAGHTVDQIYAAVKRKVSRTTVVRIRQDWAREREQQRAADAGNEQARPSRGDSGAVEKQGQLSLVGDGSVAPPLQAEGGEVEESRLGARAPESAPLVQHVGTWLLVASVSALGLHARAVAAAGRRVTSSQLRLAVDSVISALALGERCVEGVRRLATSTASMLLLASAAPSAVWVRRMLGRFAMDGGGAALHLGMARTYVQAARDEAAAEGPVFYVDNHLRPYTGMHRVPKGWRMQDKRVRPGATDYYVHDEDGRAVGRVTVPTHAPLTDMLSPITALLRLALPEEHILVAFDRAGAFPNQMAELSRAGIEFVTYERRPYALLPESAFTEKLRLGDEQLRWCESRQKNLGGGRGRVRRICVRTEEGRQVNLVAVSSRPAERLIEVMRGRWTQENGFKHGNERWGLNQLDGRTVSLFPPTVVIRNPARRRLDHALAILRVREGQVRNGLARLASSGGRHEKLERELQGIIAEQRRLEALRPTTPTHAALCETELAGKLVHHELEYKLTLDTIRIACANAESELAAELAPKLPRRREAKKMLANLFAAPGRVHVSPSTITVTLRPAGTPRELRGAAAFLASFSRRGLSLPGDQLARPVRFRLEQLR